MPAPSRATFRMRFPEFDPINDDVVDFWLDDTIAELSETNFGDCYGVAVETLAAHKLSLSGQRQTQTAEGVQPISGAVQSASADGLSVSFGASKASTGSGREYYLSQTPYGIDYLSIREKCLGRGRLAGCR